MTGAATQAMQQLMAFMGADSCCGSGVEAPAMAWQGGGASPASDGVAATPSISTARAAIVISRDWSVRTHPT